jgi:antitoxin component of MazEF toxin-antitoxin module
MKPAITVYTVYIQLLKGVISLNYKEKKGLVYMTTATVRKWGNSLAIRIPQEVAEKVKFKDGVKVSIYVNENQEVLLSKVFPAADDQKALRNHFLSLREKCKPGMNAHDEEFDMPVGDEII